MYLSFSSRSLSVADDLADDLAVPVPKVPVPERVEPAALVLLADASEPPPPFFPIPFGKLVRPGLLSRAVR
jgi:hypothetical protein